MSIKNNWKIEELQALYDKPLLSLITEASQIHAEYHNRDEVQMCALISIKTGGCPENGGNTAANPPATKPRCKPSR